MDDVDLLAINLVVVAAAWPVVFYVSVFAHELGHALAGYAMGFTITSFGLGIGPPFAVLSFGRTRIYFGAPDRFRGSRSVCRPFFIRHEEQGFPIWPGESSPISC